ncbi:MAG: hypothetical protein K2F87_01930 [Muribaculaceae bacterium]|nr:hypothetical protein [Muribaculaceae bacterium]
MKRLLPGLAATVLSAGTATAGNIPQHRISTFAAPYEAIQGTPIPCNYKAAGGTVAIYPIGIIGAPFAGKGFPIGFDLKFGGRWFNQFIVTSAGKVYLGEDEVEYIGTESFIIGMSPISHGVSDADISYLTTGEPGERVFTVQFANAKLAEDGTEPGSYDMQIRLYEADGHAEVSFRELHAPNMKLSGFDVSLHGWDNEDSLVITASDIEAQPVVTSYQEAYMLDFDSYVHWNVSDGGDLKTVNYRFDPETSAIPPKGAPTGMTVSQTGGRLDINVNRSRDARATVVMWSTSPFTDAELPGDGETFRGSTDPELETMIGDAHVIYYGPKREINLTIPDVKDDTDYYIAAISANGYPAFGVDNMEQTVYTTTASAPGALYAHPAGTGSLTVECRSAHPVIIARTTQANKGYKRGYTGLFGQPEPTAAVGDMIDGGGEVIYVGEPGTLQIDCNPNEMNYFRAWTLTGGRVSANGTDAHSLPEISLPYAPAIENYPWGMVFENWTTGPTGEDFVAWVREYYKDSAIYTITGKDYFGTTLTTPVLPLDVPFNLSFEFAMETERDPAATSDSGGILLPRGSEPGWFGPAGGLRVKVGNDTQKFINSYEGTMVGFDEQGYNDFSSSWQPVSIDVAARDGDTRITWDVRTQKASRFFLRNIVITPLTDDPVAPDTPPTDLIVSEDEDGIITIACSRGEKAEYTAVLFSEVPMTEAELPVDGVLLSVGDVLGNATVLYFGSDDEINCSTAYMIDGEPRFIFADYDTDYYIRAISANANPMYNTTSMAELTYRSLPDQNQSGIGDILTDDTSLEVFTLTGIRLDVKEISALPAGFYIVNGRKVVVKG